LFGPPSCLPLFSCIFIPLLSSSPVLSFFFSPLFPPCVRRPFQTPPPRCSVPSLAFIARERMHFP
jgi:hypothetical protein